MQGTYLSTNYFFMYKMNVHLNMFCTLVLNKITEKIYDTNIIIVYHSRFVYWTM